MRTLLILPLAIAFFAQAAALADDPYAAVGAMRTAFAQVQSATATQKFSTGYVATVEYNAPDRYRVTLPHSQIVLVGTSEYAKRAGGQWSPSSRGPSDQAMLQAVWQLAGAPGTNLHKLYNISSIGERTIDGVGVRGYRLHDVNGVYDELIWIGADNLPVAARIEMRDQDIDIHFAHYNASTLVATPM